MRIYQALKCYNPRYLKAHCPTNNFQLFNLWRLCLYVLTYFDKGLKLPPVRFINIIVVSAHFIFAFEVTIASDL